MPRLAGIRFQSAGQAFTTDRSGIARVSLPAGAHQLRLVDAVVERNGVRSRFSRWGDDSFVPSRKLDLRRPVRLEVGFEQSVQVEFDFVDRANRPVDTSRVTTITLTSTIGSRESFRPGKPRWLIAGRVARRFHGLEQTRIQYALQRAVFDGSNVVHKAQQRFYPVDNRRVVLHLLLFSARLRAHDLLFGFGVGKKLDLVYPDGRKVSFPMHGRQIVLRSLPRGTYGIKIHAAGYTPAVPLALSKDQVIDLRVISYLDMFVIALAAVAVTAFLVLVRRPHLRRRLLLVRAASPATGRRLAARGRIRCAAAPRAPAARTACSPRSRPASTRPPRPRALKRLRKSRLGPQGAWPAPGTGRSGQRSQWTCAPEQTDRRAQARSCARTATSSRSRTSTSGRSSGPDSECRVCRRARRAKRRRRIQCLSLSTA